MEMFDFFYNELKTLKALTGFNQWEKLNEGPEPEKAIKEIIKLMVDETQKADYKILKPEVIQRVIHDAIMNDQEFIGLNPKFVRRALNAWWAIYGDKILQARDQKGPEVYEKKPLDPETNAKVDALINSYVKSIKSGVFQQVPTMSREQAKEEGAERPKAHIYRKTDVGYMKQVAERIRKGRELYFRENYPGASEADLENYLNSFESEI